MFSSPSSYTQRSAAYLRAGRLLSANVNIDHVGGTKQALLVGFWIKKARYVDGRRGWLGVGR